MADIKSYIKESDLPGDLLGNLEAITVNVGSKFLAGEVSNVFAREKNIVSNAITSFNTVTDPNIIKQISTDLIEYAVKVTRDELTAYTIQKTEDLLSKDKILSGLAYYTTYWTKVHIIPASKILEKVQTKSVEEENKKSQENIKKEGIENIQTSISNGLGAINEFRDNTLNSLDAGMSTITAYLTMGPKWVVTQTNSYVKLAIEKAEGFIGDKAYFLEQQRDNVLSGIGNTIGSMAASIINKQAEKAAKKVKNKSEELISKTQTKALNAVTKAVMIVRQLTGIAIPPVYPKLPKLTSLFK